ncbi:hypothetical protein MMC25_005286 [Agyrium rufum]|nr:hypothetical protein [Agyrium rufum]
MNDHDMSRDEEKSAGEVVTHEYQRGHSTLKASKGGVVLIPQPSDDPRDPLNWPNRKKYLMLFALCFAGFAAATAPVAHQTAYFVIAESLEKTPTQLSYSISSAVAGILAGPVLIAPLARLIGRSSLIFWCLLGTFATQIWAAEASGPNGYISFVISRLFSGFFASIPTVLGIGYIMDICFLHQRGRAFAYYELTYLLGSIASPTIGGFISSSHPWPIVFWWTLAPIGIAAILVLCFVEETGFARGNDKTMYPHAPDSKISNRVATFLPGSAVVPRVSASKFVETATLPFIIGIAPVAIIAGSYTLVNFAWSVLISAELAIFLQTPVKFGGYGFTPSRNAAFTFTLWVALFAGQAIGTLCNDKIPLWACRRFGKGTWQPEYRIWSLFLPALLMPIGLGIFGAGVQHHLHYMVLALGAFLVEVSALLCVPICINYVVECFVGYTMEAAVTMGIYRLALAVGLTFYFQPWSMKVGVGWLFGMAAFFSLFLMFCMMVLAWKGHVLRRYVLLRSIDVTEAGKVVNASQVDLASEESASSRS